MNTHKQTRLYGDTFESQAAAAAQDAMMTIILLTQIKKQLAQRQTDACDLDQARTSLYSARFGMCRRPRRLRLRRQPLDLSQCLLKGGAVTLLMTEAVLFLSLYNILHSFLDNFEVNFGRPI